MTVDLENILAAIGTAIGAGGLGAFVTAWWNGRNAARKMADDARKQEADERRVDAKQRIELNKEAGEWERQDKVKEEDFLVNMRKRLVLEMKADNDNIRKRLDDRENAERELRRECENLQDKCESLRKKCEVLQEEHATCQAENKDLRLQIAVLRRAVKQIEKKQSGSDEKEAPTTPVEPATPTTCHEAETIDHAEADGEPEEPT